MLTRCRVGSAVPSTACGIDGGPRRITEVVLNEQSLPVAGSGSSHLTRPSSATKGLPILDRRRDPFLPWNLSEEKKKELGKAGLPQGDDTS